VSVDQQMLVGQLKETIAACRLDPDLPFWGEVFVLLHQMKQVSRRQMPLYEIEPYGEVAYDPVKRRFVVKVPELDIMMKDSELADAIVKQGMFLPK